MHYCSDCFSNSNKETKAEYVALTTNYQVEYLCARHAHSALAMGEEVAKLVDHVTILDREENYGQ